MKQQLNSPGMKGRNWGGKGDKYGQISNFQTDDKIAQLEREKGEHMNKSEKEIDRERNMDTRYGELGIGLGLSIFW